METAPEQTIARRRISHDSYHRHHAARRHRPFADDVRFARRHPGPDERIPQEYVREEYANVGNPDPIRDTHRQIGMLLGNAEVRGCFEKARGAAQATERCVRLRLCLDRWSTDREAAWVSVVDNLNIHAFEGLVRWVASTGKIETCRALLSGSLVFGYINRDR